MEHRVVSVLTFKVLVCLCCEWHDRTGSLLFSVALRFMESNCSYYCEI